MSRYVALLRGINVGGHRRVAMAELRELLVSLGHTDVTTYLQSGQAVFTSTRRGGVKIAQEIEAALGWDVKVLVRTQRELAGIVERNPFPEGTRTPRYLHVAFLSARPAPERLSSIDPGLFTPDEFRAGERELYVWYPNGQGRSKLTNELWERRLGLTATMRNWNTVTKLLDLASG